MTTTPTTAIPSTTNMIFSVVDQLSDIMRGTAIITELMDIRKIQLMQVIQVQIFSNSYLKLYFRETL